MRVLEFDNVGFGHVIMKALLLLVEGRHQVTDAEDKA